jgi:hypothetical protein
MTRPKTNSYPSNAIQSAQSGVANRYHALAALLSWPPLRDQQVEFASRENQHRRQARKRGTRVGREFANVCIERALARGLDKCEIDFLVGLHERICRRPLFAMVEKSSFKRSMLTAFRRFGRRFIEQDGNDAATVAATLWYVFRHRQTPTAHDLFEVFAAWQGKRARPRRLVAGSPDSPSAGL